MSDKKFSYLGQFIQGLRTPAGATGGSTAKIDPRSQGVIPRRFKRKKKFVTPQRRTDGQKDVLVEIVM